MRNGWWTALGLVAMATPAVAQNASQSSTYTPGHGTAGLHVSPYINRGEVAHPNARGGGPRSEPTARETPVVRTPRHEHARSLQSDNQTRRPGPQNYTAPAQKQPPIGGHTIPSGPGVSMVGDDFRSHTGSATRGPIGTRAPSSNEEHFTAQPTARGGGPWNAGVVILPNGAHEALAPRAHPFRWPHIVDAQDVAIAEVRLTDEDFRQLPFRGDGTGRAGDGLLARAPAVRTSQLIRMPANTVLDFQLATGYPATTIAIGGGPPSFSRQFERTLDSVPGR